MKAWLAAIWLCACGGSSASVPADASAPDAPATTAIAVPITGCTWSFTATLSIGGAPFRLLVDSGSLALAVAAQNCATCSDAGVQDLYTPGATATDEHHAATMTYGGGGITWTGEEYRDTVAIGSATAPVDLYAISSQQNLIAPDQCGNPDGILGLAGTGTSSLVSQLAATGLSDVFAMHECGNAGTLWFGGFDPAAATGAVTYVAMAQTPLYELSVSGFAVGTSQVGLAAPLSSIVDSGGPVIIVPPATYASLTQAIAANPTFAAVFGDASWFASSDPCAAPAMTKAEIDAALPPLTIQLGGQSVTLAATDSYLELVPDDSGTRYCGALASQPGITKLDLGNSLIRSQLVIFDRANARMGLAPVAACRGAT